MDAISLRKFALGRWVADGETNCAGLADAAEVTGTAGSAIRATSRADAGAGHASATSTKISRTSSGTIPLVLVILRMSRRT